MFGNLYSGKKVVVTGNTGFKGTWLTAWLLKLGAEVVGISVDIPTNPSMFQELRLNERIKYHQFDIGNLEKVSQVIKECKPDFLFHLAAQPLVSISYSDPINTINANVLGTTNILEALRRSNYFCTVVIITSDKCYDNVEWAWGYKETDALGGKDIYSGSKGAAELICKSYYHSYFKKPDSNIRLATARAGNVIGGGDWAKDRIIPDCIRAWSTNTPVEIRNPNATRPWQHVLEPLSGYLHLGQALNSNAELNGESFNFGPPAHFNYPVLSLIEGLAAYWQDTGLDSFYKITSNESFSEASLLKLNCDKALFYLNWLPTLSYQNLLEFTGDWYSKFYEKSSDMFDLTVGQIKLYEGKAIRKEQPWAKSK